MAEKKKKVIKIVRRKAREAEQEPTAAENSKPHPQPQPIPDPRANTMPGSESGTPRPAATAVPAGADDDIQKAAPRRRIVRRERITVQTRGSGAAPGRRNESPPEPESIETPPSEPSISLADDPPPSPSPGREAPTPYEELLDSIYDAVLITDADASVIEVNQRALASLQYDQDELSGKPLLTLLPDADINFLKTLKQMPASKYALIETRCRRRDGSYYPAEIAVKAMGGRGNNIAFFIRNITRRREAEAQLTIANNAVMNSLTAIIVTDEKGIIRFENPAAIKIFSVTGDSAQNRQNLNIADFFIDQDIIAKAFEELRELNTWQGEMRVRRAEGRSIDTEVSATPNIHEGKLNGFVFSVIDITTEKAARRQHEINERNAATIAALGTACHHLSQPATVLCINAEILEQFSGHCDDPEMAELLKQNLEAVNDLQDKLRILNDMTHFHTEKYLEREDSIDEVSNTILSI